VSPVHSPLIQQVAANIPHDAGFAPDPDPATALRKRELSHRVLQPSPDPSDRSTVMQPCHLKPRRRFQRQLFVGICDFDEDMSETRRGQCLKDRPNRRQRRFVAAYKIPVCLVGYFVCPSWLIGHRHNLTRLGLLRPVASGSLAVQ
jgi:hypothetical protein